MKNSKQTVVPFLCVMFILLLVGTGTASDAKRGARIYQQYCTPCHGQEGNGRGPRAKNEALQPPPRNHTDGFYMNMQSDVRLFKVIKFGGKENHLSHVMPQWKHILKDKEILSIIAHLRALAQNPEYVAPNTQGWGKNPYAGDEREQLKDHIKKQ